MLDDSGNHAWKHRSATVANVRWYTKRRGVVAARAQQSLARYGAASQSLREVVCLAHERHIELDIACVIDLVQDPRRPRLPIVSTSGCTTRMCRVSASLREKVFSSRHMGHLTFCLRPLWIVSS